MLDRSVYKTAGLAIPANLQAALYAAFTLLWFAVVAFAVYDFRNPAALAQFQAALPYYADVLTHVPRNISALPFAVLFLFSGAGAGDALCSALRLHFRSGFTRVAAALALGIACWTFAIVAAGSAQLLTAQVLIPLLFAGALFSIIWFAIRRNTWRGSLDGAIPREPWARFVAIAGVLIVIASLYFAMLGALQPEIEFDAKVYHLTAAKRYAQHGGFYNLGVSEGLPSLDFPQYQEDLYAGGYVIDGMSGAKMLSWSMLLIAALAIAGIGAELFGSLAVGALAAAIFAATPIVTWSAATANTDLGQVPFFLLALYAVLRARNSDRAWGWFIFAGFASGFAIGIKPFALAGCAVLIPLLVKRKMGVRAIAGSALLFAAGAIAGVLPSLIRTAALTGDPFFPIAAGVFHSALWSPAAQTLASSAYHDYGANTSWRILPFFPFLVTVRVDQYRDVLGPLYLFAAPVLVLFALRRDAHPLLRVFLGILAAWTLLWFASGAIEARYAEALFPLVALAAAWVAFLPGARIFAVLLLAASVLNLQPLVGFQRNASLPYTMGTVRYQWDYLYGCEAEDNVQLQYAPMLAWMNTHLNAHRDRVYAATDDYLYNLYSDVELYAGASPWQQAVNSWTLQSPDAYARLSALHIDYVLVPQAQQTALNAAPLGAHLQEVTSAPAIDPGGTDILYRIVGAQS